MRFGVRDIFGVVVSVTIFRAAFVRGIPLEGLLLVSSLVGPVWW